jgi:hypothetical protein
VSFTTCSIIRRAARQLGAELPAAFTRTVDEQSLIVSRAQDFLARGDNTNQLIADALAEGKDPLADKIVRESIMVRSVTGLSSDVDRARDRAARSAIAEHSDGILAAFAATLQDDAQTLVTGARTLPDSIDPTSGGAAPASLGASALATFGSVRAANERFEHGRQAATAVTNAAGISGGGTRHAPVIVAPADLDQYERACELSPTRKANAWHFAKVGVVPDLIHNGAELAERVAALQAEDSRRAAAHAERERLAGGQPFAFRIR